MDRYIDFKFYTNAHYFLVVYMCRHHKWIETDSTLLAFRTYNGHYSTTLHNLPVVKGFYSSVSTNVLEETAHFL